MATKTIKEMLALNSGAGFNVANTTPATRTPSDVFKKLPLPTPDMTRYFLPGNSVASKYPAIAPMHMSPNMGGVKERTRLEKFLLGERNTTNLAYKTQLGTYHEYLTATIF